MVDDDEPGLRVLHHKANAVGGESRVNREVDSSRFHNRQQRGNEVDGAGEGQGYNIAGLYVGADHECAGDAVNASAELDVCETLVAANESCVVGERRGGLFEELGDA